MVFLASVGGITLGVLLGVALYVVWPFRHPGEP